MLEALLIMGIFYVCTLMPLRGKSFQQLTPKQLQTLEKHFNTYKRSKKGKQNPSMTNEEYLPIIQKQALNYLIMVAVILPIYLVVIATLYSQYFSQFAR